MGADGSFIYLEDPSCILRSFMTFAEYAWIIIVFITGILLFGWAISMIRGAKNDIFTNLRNLVLIFGVLAAAGPIINMIYGDDLFKRGCRTIKVELSEVNRLLDARKLKLSTRDQYDLYEEFDIYDSGANIVAANSAPHEIPYADAPIASAGAPDTVAASITPDTNTAIATAPQPAPSPPPRPWQCIPRVPQNHPKTLFMNILTAPNTAAPVAVAHGAIPILATFVIHNSHVAWGPLAVRAVSPFFPMKKPACVQSVPCCAAIVIIN